MAASVASPAPPETLEGVHRDRLFVASCCALAVSAVAFAVIGDILTTLKAHFESQPPLTATGRSARATARRAIGFHKRSHSTAQTASCEQRPS